MPRVPPKVTRQRAFTCCPDGSCEDCKAEESRYRKQLYLRNNPNPVDPQRRRQRFLVQPMEWEDRANCKERWDLPWEMEADHADDKKRAKALAREFCFDCPVRSECLKYGIATKSMGIWGGSYLAWEPRKRVVNLIG